MSVDPTGGPDWSESWNRLFVALSVEPRREIIRSLLNEPIERRLPLPEAAASPNQSMDSETLARQLRHHHLPKLAELGYIRWSSDPFCVQRGPNFEQPAFIIQQITGSVDEIPDSLISNCRILQEMA